MTEPRKTTVYYDGACPLCQAEISLYSKGPGGEELILHDVSDPDAPLPEGLSQEDSLARFHVTAPSGETLSGAAAFFALWASLPRWRVLAALGRLPGVIPLAELCYRGFLRLRPRLVRLFSWWQQRRTKAPPP